MGSASRRLQNLTKILKFYRSRLGLLEPLLGLNLKSQVLKRCSQRKIGKIVQPVVVEIKDGNH